MDEWGAVWANLGPTQLGEVKEFPLKNWADFDKLSIPDVDDAKRWEGMAGARARVGDKYLLGGGVSLYERIHFFCAASKTPGWTSTIIPRSWAACWICWWT